MHRSDLPGSLKAGLAKSAGARALSERLRLACRVRRENGKEGTIDGELDRTAWQDSKSILVRGAASGLFKHRATAEA